MTKQDGFVSQDAWGQGPGARGLRLGYWAQWLGPRGVEVRPERAKAKALLFRGGNLRKITSVNLPYIYVICIYIYSYIYIFIICTQYYIYIYI